MMMMMIDDDFSFSATNLDFHLFADDSNLFYSHKNLQSLEQNLNEKTNFIVFHPAQKKITIV